MRLSILLLLLLYVGIVVCRSRFSADSIRVRGVSPDLLPLYRKSAPFKCISDPTIRIPVSRINDDYCDCPDGSDEPGTSACVTGSFYCSQVGFTPMIINSSQVNDGICDCCDGNDEWKGRTSCANKCVEMGNVQLKQKKDFIIDIQIGVEMRKGWIDSSKVELPPKRERLAVVKLELEKMGAIVDMLNEKKTTTEKDWNDAVAEKEEMEEAWRKENEPVEDDGGSDDDIFDDAALEEQLEHEEIPEDIEGEVQDGTVDDTDTDEEETEVQPTPAPPPQFPELELKIEAKREIYDAARDAATTQSSEKSKLQEEIDSISKYTDADLGVEGEYWGLFENKMEQQIGEYKYTVEVFGKAQQGHTTLGEFDGFNDDHTVAYWKHGTKCWGGPERELSLSISCGAKNEVLTIEEPNKCIYSGTMTTPAACTPRLLLQLEQEVEQEESALFRSQDEL